MRHLKSTSATGFLRMPGREDRVQDLPRKPLLCRDCEQRFSDWEREFSIHAFPLIQGGDFESFKYGDWLLRFAVSLSWRVLVSDKEGILNVHPEWTKHIEDILERWCCYLLGLTNQPGSKHHLFVIPGVPSSVPRNAHPKTLHYLLRAIDATEMIGHGFLGVYVKLIRSIFFSPILPIRPSGWKATQIYAGGGRVISSKQALSMDGFGDFIQSRVQVSFDKDLSPKAINQIRKSFEKDPGRALGSESHVVHLATERLWGDENPQPDK